MVHGAGLGISGTADLFRLSEAKAQEVLRRGWVMVQGEQCWESNSINAKSISNVASKCCEGVNPIRSMYLGHWH